MVILSKRESEIAANLCCYATAQHMLTIPTAQSDLSRAEMTARLFDYLTVCAKFGLSRADVETEARRIAGDY